MASHLPLEGGPGSISFPTKENSIKSLHEEVTVGLSSAACLKSDVAETEVRS